MRAFIGIDFSKELKSEISRLQARLRTISNAGRWKYVDNFHLTLKFLDDIDEKQAKEIGSKLSAICGRTSSFQLGMSELGNFPGKGCLRVVWMSLLGELDKLRSLHSSIDQELMELGFEKERRGYMPHVTIGQDVVFNQSFEEIKMIMKSMEYPEIYVNKLILFKSDQIGNKRVYSPMSAFNLMGG